MKKVAASYAFVITDGPAGARKRWLIDLRKAPIFVGLKDDKVPSVILAFNIIKPLPLVQCRTLKLVL